MKKRSGQFFKSAISFLVVFLMVIVSIIYPSSKIKADGFPNDATGVSPNGKYYSAGRENRLGMVTSDELHTATELFGFCMANSKKYPGYDSKKDEYFGVYEQILNLNKESFNKLVRDNHTYGNVPTSPEELWDKVSKLIYIYLKDPTNVIGQAGWTNPQDAMYEFYTVVQQEIWRYTDGQKVDKDTNSYLYYKYSKQGQKAVYLLRDAVNSISIPSNFELRGYKPEWVQGQKGYQAIVTGRLKVDQPVGEIKTTVTAGGKTSSENDIATLKAQDVIGGVEVSDKITYSGLYPNTEYDVIGEIYEVKDGELVNPGRPVSVVNSGDDLKTDATGKGKWTLNFGKLDLEAGKSYVVFEKVVSLKNVIDTDGDGKPDKKQELSHNDPKDKSQTFTILPKEIVEQDVVFSKVNVAGEEIAGAKIQLKDAQGQVVHSWTSKAGQSETVKLKAGTYTFHEESAPTGYLAVTDITFEVDAQGKVTVKDANGNSVKADGNKLTVTDKAAPSVPNEQDVVFSKVNVAGEEIAGAKIQLKDAQGQVVHSWTSQAGQSETVKLKAGTYTFHEESAPTGYLAVTDITFEVDAQGKVTVKDANGNSVKAAGNKLTVTDKAAPSVPNEQDVVFSKVNIAGEEIAGAKIQLKDAQGQVVHSWTSQAGQSETVKLKAGTYTFHEESAPTGYLAVTDITFEVDAQGKVTVKDANGNSVKAAGNKLTVTDKAAPSVPNEQDVVFSKVNVAGEEIAGAKIQLKDAQGQVVHSWTSKAGQSETVKLKAGTYTFHEESAPTGYLAVTDITFEVDAQGKVTVKDANGNSVKAAGNKLTVTDKAAPSVPNEQDVVFSKVNVAGEEIAGAKIQLKDAQGQVVHSWTSKAGQSETVKLKAGTYTFHEESAPTGYLAVTDITFEVDAQGKVTVKDANGNSVKADGNKLTVTDKAAPSVPNEQDVVFSKVNVAGEEIAGAKIQLKDAQGQVVHSWTSQAGQSETVKLKAGTYTFHEESAPTGYLAVTDITFEVDAQGKVTVKDANGNSVKADGNKLTVTDKAAPSVPNEQDVVFSKVNVAGEEIAGAKIQLKDAQGQVVHSWTSKAGQSETVKLKAGTYTFHEKSAPTGYLAVTDITFEVDAQGKVTVKDANGNSVKADGNKLTVTDKAAPSVPTPGKSKTPSTPKQNLPQTGDGVKLSLYAWLMLISGSLLAIVGYARRKNER